MILALVVVALLMVLTIVARADSPVERRVPVRVRVDRPVRKKDRLG